MASPTSLGALDALAADPARAGLFTDFDGTLSAIVDNPLDARPLPGAVEALVRLTGTLGQVAVLSGRPVAYVGAFLPPEIVIAGLYGLETRIGGVVRDHPSAGLWREVVADVVAGAAAGRGPAGMRVEDKGLSLTAHYRGRPELAAEVRAWATEEAARSGLMPHDAKMSVELHPPVAADKGTALRSLAEGLDVVAFLGDDRGDLPAYDELDRLAAEGRTAVRVAVGGPEQADELVARADVVADGPAAVVAMLTALADRVAPA